MSRLALLEAGSGNDMIVDVEAGDFKRETKILFGGTILVDGSLEEMSSYRSEAMGTITTAIVLYLLRLFLLRIYSVQRQAKS